MLGILLALSILAGAAAPTGADPGADGVFPEPPWRGEADETAAPASPAFLPCAGLALMAVAQGARITNVRYSVSPRWGHIVRVRSVANDGFATAFHFTCWFKTGHGDSRISVAPEHMF